MTQPIQPKLYYKPHAGTLVWTIHPDKEGIYTALDAGILPSQIRQTFHLTRKQLEHQRRKWRKSRKLPTPDIHKALALLPTIRRMLTEKHSRRHICTTLNLTKGQLSGLIFRHGEFLNARPISRTPTPPRHIGGTR